MKTAHVGVLPVHDNDHDPLSETWLGALFSGLEKRGASYATLRVDTTLFRSNCELDSLVHPGSLWTVLDEIRDLWNSGQLAERILQVIGDPAGGIDRRRRARDRIGDLFRVEQTSAAVERMYLELLIPRGSGTVS